MARREPRYQRAVAYVDESQRGSRYLPAAAAIDKPDPGGCPRGHRPVPASRHRPVAGGRPDQRGTGSNPWARLGTQPR
jgi:hypothetical protein